MVMWVDFSNNKGSSSIYARKEICPINVVIWNEDFLMRF
jgi:hypothetical protein